MGVLKRGVDKVKKKGKKVIKHFDATIERDTIKVS